MNSLVLVIIGACVLIIGYRFYGYFVTGKVLQLDGNRPTPAEVHEDGRDYVPTNKWVLFGHHFAAIAGAGPLVGPVLAAQFGFLPGVLWILIGGVLAGAVHDSVLLFASVRHDGKSLAEIARDVMGKRMGYFASVAIILILILTMAGLALPIVNSLNNSPWGTFTVGFTIPVAIFIGIYLKYIRPGKIAEGTVIGMVLILLGVVLGPYIEHTVLGPILTLSIPQMSIILAVYGFVAAVLPVWLLLLPRDYLSTYMKIGVIAALAIGIFFVHPNLQMPAVTKFVNGGGPIVSGKVFPYVFITIACGALSGFHSIISTGTTPKLIQNEKDILPIGFGAMLVESFVALMALIAATVLPSSDYFAINSLPAVFAKLHMIPAQLPMLNQLVGEKLAGRAGGSVSLAVGMAYIFYKIPGLHNLMSYWYHFCIMFEALFILTAIDSGTRIGRYLFQDLFSRLFKPFANKRANWNIVLFSALMSFCWGYLLYTGNISTIWPLFGTANQMLASISFAIVTTMLLQMGKKKYILITVIPMAFITVVTFTAAIENILVYVPAHKYLLAVLSGAIVLIAVVIIGESIKAWIEFFRNESKHGQMSAPAPQTPEKTGASSSVD